MLLVLLDSHPGPTFSVNYALLQAWQELTASEQAEYYRMRQGQRRREDLEILDQVKKSLIQNVLLMEI
jgi:hypothetical protein